MRKRRILPQRLAATCAAATALVLLLRPPARGDSSSRTSADRRNAAPIILISVDTLRADHLGLYGYKGLATTHIDRIGAGGTVFFQANSQVPLTLPSHVSLLTSTYPFVNGIEDNGLQLAPNAVTLAGVLKSHGYKTAAFVGGFVLDRRFGLDQGFDTYDAPSNPHPKPGEDPGDIKRFAESVTQAATRWLEQNADQPFFLFVHLYDLHTPYTLPSSERGRGFSYDAQLGYVDDVLGRFWDVLEQRGIVKKALVVFTADHGESLHEHGESTHGYFVYQSTLRVPLIIHWPEQSSSFPSRIDEPVSLLDVAPTLLQVAGFERPAEFQGRGLLNLIGAPVTSAQKASAPEEIYSESLYAHTHLGTSGLQSLRMGRYKYIKAPHPELYDLLQDPAETQNLYDSQKLKALGLRARLESLRAPYLSGHAPAKSVAHPEATERLRSLGYLAGTSPRESSSSDSGVDPKERIGDYEQYGHAIALATAGHLRASTTTLEQLLDKDPNMLDVRVTLGLNQQKLGLHAEAAENFKAVLKRDPQNVIAHFDLAVSEHSLGRQEDAINELEATLALAPYYVRAEEMLAKMYLDGKNYEKARSLLSHMIRLDPTSYTANYNLGVLDCLQGNWQDGELHLRAAIQAQPASAEAHNTFGSLHLRRGDFDLARAEFMEAIRLNPQFASPHYNLGVIFRQQNRDAEAAQQFREALSADPHFQPARTALDRLKLGMGQNE